MSRAIYISVRTKCSFRRSELQNSKRGENVWIRYFDECLFNGEIYDKIMTDSTLSYSLKRDVVEEEWVDFLRAFYDIRYVETGLMGGPEEADKIIADLRMRKTYDEFMNLAKENEYCCNFYEYLHNQDCFEFNQSNAIYADSEEIVLYSSVYMDVPPEGWPMMHYFLRTMQDRLGRYRLAKSLDMKMYN